MRNSLTIFEVSCNACSTTEDLNWKKVVLINNNTIWAESWCNLNLNLICT